MSTHAFSLIFELLLNIFNKVYSKQCMYVVSSVRLHLSALNEPTWASVSVCTNVIVVYVSLCLLSLVWKKWISNARKGSNMKILETQSMCRTWRVYLKNSGQFKSAEQTRDSWKHTTKHKTQSNTIFQLMIHSFSTGKLLTTFNSVIIFVLWTVQSVK